MTADKKEYLKQDVQLLQKIWPDNKSYTIACHGHSIVCGYMAENITKPFDAYPHLMHGRLSERFPHSVINVIVTAIGGENSVGGAARFQEDVLCHRPSLVTIDYGRNDMFLTEEQMREAWTSMIVTAKKAGVKVILVTPGADSGVLYYREEDRKLSDARMAEIIRELAEQYEVGLADAHEAFECKFRQGHHRSDYAASLNHINRKGHELITDQLMEWFPY